jgi:hypothetical protein
LNLLIKRFGTFFEKNTSFFIALVLCIYASLVFINLTTGHNWGDDFAQYLLQSKGLISNTVSNVVQGANFTNANSSTIYSPVTVPWGFPLFLVPFVKLFGMNMMALKLSNFLVYSGFLIMLYLWCRLRLSKGCSFLIFLFFAFNPTLINFHNQLLSDLLFLFCSTASLYLLELFFRSSNRKGVIAVLLGFAIFYASFTRPGGYLLLLALCVTQIFQAISFYKHKSNFQWKDFIPQVIPYLVVLFCFCLQFLLLFSQTEQISSAYNTSLETIGKHILFYLQLPAAFFDGSRYTAIPYLLSLPFLFIGMRATLRSSENQSPFFYFLFSLISLIFYKGIQSLRYIFPILPIYLLFSAAGFSQVIQRTTPKRNTLMIGLLSVFSALIIAQFMIAEISSGISNLEHQRIEAQGPYSSQSTEMFNFIRSNTPADSVMVFFKPRAMRLLTDRNSIYATTCQTLERGDYLVWMNPAQLPNNKLQISGDEMESCIKNLVLEKIFENKESTIYAISKQ